MNNQIERGSFRDPAGFVFFSDGAVYRQINHSGKSNYEKFMQSGLYKKLVESSLIVSHEESDIPFPSPDQGWKVIRPEKIDFISYPYEWSFSQLKDAALATLQIQKISLEYGMSLKDASSYNIQFQGLKPLLIDSLSFEPYTEGSPWVAYKQFCQHFLAPLALMAYKDIRLQQLLRNNIDGLPLDLTNSLLPFRSVFNLSILFHINLHAKSQSYYSDKGKQTSGNKAKISRTSLLGLIDSLETGVTGLKYKSGYSQWGDYYSDTNYSTPASEHKKQLIEEFIEQIAPENLWDLGANTGVYSIIATSKKIKTIAFDTDFNAVEQNYLHSKSSKDSLMLPLLLDLTNPSPSIGWGNSERMSFMQRGPVEAIMALALIHHLAIANNLPLSNISEFFSQLCNHLIIEFVPRSDSQVERLLASREDIFQSYTIENFELAFKKHFEISRREAIKESERTLYLMTKKN